MKLTESKLKKIINEVLNENRGQAEKVFSMLEDSYSLVDQKIEDEGSFNQAVSFAISLNLVNDILEIINEKLAENEGWQYYKGGDRGPEMPYLVGAMHTDIKKRFIKQVAADMGSMAMKSHRSKP